MTATRPFWRQTAAIVVAGVALGLLPLGGLDNRFLQTFTVAFLFAIPAFGLGLLYGEAGQMSVASGALYGIGAYSAAIGARDETFSVWPAMVIGALAAAFAATLVGLAALRVRGHYFLIVTFAFAELWRITTVNLRGITGGNQGIMVLDDVSVPIFGDIDSLRSFYYLALGFALVAAFVIVMLRFSAFGRSLRVVRENERLAVSLGLNAARIRLVAFAISGALAGAAGTLYAYDLKHVGPDLFGAATGIQIVLIVLIGGVRSAIGALIGSLVFFALPELVDVDPVSTQIVYGIALIAIVLISPEGLVPRLADWVADAWRFARRRHTPFGP